MSLILDALRKSEAERRRGATPDLLSQAVPAAPSTRAAMPRHWRWLLAASAAATAIALFLWWPRAAVTADAVATTADPATTMRRDVVRAAVAGSTAPATNPATPAVARTPDSAARPITPPDAVPGPATTVASAPARPASAAPSSVAPPTVQGPPVPLREAPATANAEPPARALEAPAPPLATAAPAATFSSATLPLRLADLTGEERRQLPALKVSMHMWAPDAGNRFAIIDGSRVGEGDRVGEALIEAIQQDGVLLSWRGRQIRLPIR